MKTVFLLILTTVLVVAKSHASWDFKPFCAELTIGQSLSIYPNPARTSVSISWDDMEIRKYQIVDITGKTKLEGTPLPGTSQMSIDISSCAPGIYMIKVWNRQNETATERLNIVD